MCDGKITVESGNQKAIFNFVGNECSIDFEPNIDMKKDEFTDEELFVRNVAGLLIGYLSGQKD